VGKSVKEGRLRTVILVPAVLVGALIFAVVASPLLAGRDVLADEECAKPSYEAQDRSWEELPPASVDQSSDGCVGYCFNAVIESESDDDSRARVVLPGDNGALTRGVVDRTRVLRSSVTAVQEGEPVRFACFDRIAGPGGAPLFDDCVQMAAYESDDAACGAQSEAISDASRIRDAFEMFRFRL
jgi:hypothetical protein